MFCGRRAVQPAISGPAVIRIDVTAAICRFVIAETVQDGAKPTSYRRRLLMTVLLQFEE